MRKFKRYFIFFCTIFCVSTLFAQETPPKEQPRSWLLYQSEISKLWKIQNEFLDRDNLLEGDQLLKQILFLKTSYGLNQIPSLSMSLLRKVPQQKTLADKIKHPYYQMAIQISPDHYTNDYYLCNFLSDPLEWTTAVRYCFVGLKKELSSPSEQLVFLSKISYQVFWTVILLLIFYFGAYVYKFLPFTIQYYSSTFYWISPISFSFLTLMMSLLIFFTFGWLFFFVLVFILLWRFPSIAEKTHLVFLICLTLCLPFTFTAPAINKQFHNGILFSLFNAEQSLQPAKFEERITQYTRTHGRDAFALFKLGILEKKVGNFEEAKKNFEQSKAANPYFIKTDVNLANLKFEMGDVTAAEEDYKKLISKNPKLISPYMNLSQIYTNQSKYLDGEAFMNQAKGIDENRFKELSKQLYQRNGAVRPIYENLEPSDVYGLIYERDEGFKFQFLQFFNHYFSKYSPKIFYYTLILAILIAFIFHFLTNTRNFYLLYYTREKNLENLTLVQLREYPAMYKKFAASMDLKEDIKYFFCVLFPGYSSFCKESLVKSSIFASMFYFFLTGCFIEASYQNLNSSFPWMEINIIITTFIFIANWIDTKVTNGKKKN